MEQGSSVLEPEDCLKCIVYRHTYIYIYMHTYIHSCIYLFNLFICSYFHIYIYSIHTYRES